MLLVWAFLQTSTFNVHADNKLRESTEMNFSPELTFERVQRASLASCFFYRQEKMDIVLAFRQVTVAAFPLTA